MAQNNKKTNPSDAKKVRSKQRLQTLLYLGILFGSIAAIVLVLTFVVDPLMLYSSAGEYVQARDYNKAIEMYSELDGFLNSEKKLAEVQDILIEKALNEGDYQTALLAVEQSGAWDSYVSEHPELFYNYAKECVVSNPSTAKTYVGYVLEYPGAKELYDEACLRNALQLMEMERYADALKNFDEASSLAWFEEIEPAAAFAYAVDIAEYSYLRAAKVFELIADVNSAAAEKNVALKNYLAYCGEKSCLSDSTSAEAVGLTNVFDFFVMDETEYLIVTDGDLNMVEDASNYAFAKDTDGSYFAFSADSGDGMQYLYRFYLLDNGVLQEKTTVTAPDGTETVSTRLWG